MDEATRVSLKDLSDKIDRVLNALLGNGTEGLLIRVDRIERRAAFLNKFMWSIGGATAIALGTALVTAFIK